MAGVSTGSDAFFSVSPAELTKPECFAVGRAELDVRVDAKYYALREILNSPFPLAHLGKLVHTEPDYGLSSRAVRRTSEDDPRYIRITDFGEDGIEIGHEYVTAEPADMSYGLSAGDMLFARSGATVGKTYLHEDTSEPAIFAGYCIRFRFDRTKVSPKFVYWWTKTSAYSRWVETIQRPSGQPNINKEEFKGCPIPLVPGSGQDILVAIMDAARAERKTKLAQANALLASIDDFVLDALGIAPPKEEMRHVFAVHASQISREHRLNADYYHPERTKTVSDIRADQQNLESRQLAEVVRFRREQLKVPSENYLSLAHVQSDTGELTSATLAASGNCLAFQADDILFARLRPYLNKVYRAEMNGCCSTEFRVMQVRDRQALLPEYLATILRSRIVLAQTIHMMTGNTHPRLTAYDVATIVIPIPDLEVQSAISAEINHRREEARRLRAEAEASWNEAKARFEARLLGDAS